MENLINIIQQYLPESIFAVLILHLLFNILITKYYADFKNFTNSLKNSLILNIIWYSNRILLYFDFYALIGRGEYENHFRISLAFNFFAIFLGFILNFIIGFFVTDKLYKMEHKKSIFFVIINLLVEFGLFLILFVALILLGINVLVRYENVVINEIIIGIIKAEILLSTIYLYHSR